MLALSLPVNIEAEPAYTPAFSTATIIPLDSKSVVESAFQYHTRSCPDSIPVKVKSTIPLDAERRTVVHRRALGCAAQ